MCRKTTVIVTTRIKENIRKLKINLTPIIKIDIFNLFDINIKLSILKKNSLNKTNNSLNTWDCDTLFLSHDWNKMVPYED